MFRLRRQVYLDHNATTPVSTHVRRRMSRVLKSYFGNPSSLYRAARDSALLLEESRQTVARAIGAEPHEILFTGSATEANNTVLNTVFESGYPAKRRIITTPIEHASVLETLEHLASRGAQVVFCPVDRAGRVDPEAVRQLVDRETLLVCVMLANNEIGTLQDVGAIAAIARQAGVLVMSDCVQGLAKIELDVKALAVDYASFSAHKIHGPKGVGCLYAREGAPVTPLIHGGHQENGLRAGTEGLHNIAGFAAACETVETALAQASRVRRLRERLATDLQAARSDIAVNSPAEDCLPNTLSVTFPGVSNALFMAGLDAQGISVSAGSACDTQEDSPSHVLKAIGLTDEQTRQTLRLTLSTETSDRDIEYAARIFREYLGGETERIAMVPPNQLDEKILFDDGTFILDVRFRHDRLMLKGLPNSHEVPFLKAKRYFHRVPRDKNILVACQTGPNSPFVAYQLRARRFKKVSILLTGIVGWRLARPDLYRKYSGQNVVSLEP